MKIEIGGLNARSTLRTFITRKMAETFEGLARQPTTVRIGFVDENGPKGGVDIRCGIDIDLPRRAPIHVEERAESARLAFDGARLALETRIQRERERGRTERRRPKKYFLAKKLLMPDETIPKLESAPRPARRAALRRFA